MGHAAGSGRAEATGQAAARPVPGAAPCAPPGSGWPEDPATPRTPAARDAADVVRIAARASAAYRPDEPHGRGVPVALDAAVSVCRACPRLVEWREHVALTRRRAYLDQPYWGRPVPGFGDPAPRVLVVGLAPAAHGANRTGRMFTGDRSGEWLYAALHRAGLADRPESTAAGDGLRLHGTRIVSAVRCAPPGNAPTPAERDSCRPWLAAELRAVWPGLRSIVVLGAFGWQAFWPALAAAGVEIPSPRPVFGHGQEIDVFDGSSFVADGSPARRVLGCFHVSQQNTFTGKLTAPMLDAVFARAAAFARGENGRNEVKRT